MTMNLRGHMSANDSRPGAGCRPREVTGRMVLICLVAFFAVVGGVNAIMVRAAISTFGGVETENSYQAGLAFAQQIAAVEAQDALHWDLRAKASADAGGSQLDVTASDTAGAPL